jgi:hypothetical protein
MRLGEVNPIAGYRYKRKLLGGDQETWWDSTLPGFGMRAYSPKPGSN